MTVSCGEQGGGMLTDEQLIEGEQSKDDGMDQRDDGASGAIEDAVPIHGDGYSLTRVPEIMGTANGGAKVNGAAGCAGCEEPEDR